jgi:WD40 repeat protein
MFAAAFARAPIVSEHNNDTSSSSSSPPIFVGSGPNFKSDYSHLRLTDEENDKKRRRQLKKQNKQQHGGKDNNMMINKRQRNAAYAAKNLNPSNYDAVESLSSGVSHSGHVAGLQFTKDGRYLASVGALDGELAVWDLMRGARLASKFVVAGGLPATTPRQRGRVPLCIEDNNNGSSWDSTIWIPREEKILAFSLMDGGCPTQSLSGSLSGIESLTINRFDKTLFSGSQDGMVLSWGVQPYRNHAILDRQQQEEDIDKW